MLFSYYTLPIACEEYILNSNKELDVVELRYASREFYLLLVLLVLQVIKVTSIYRQRGLTNTGLLASLITKDKDEKIPPAWKDVAMHSN